MDAELQAERPCPLRAAPPGLGAATRRSARCTGAGTAASGSKLPDPAWGPGSSWARGPASPGRSSPSCELSDVVQAPWHDHEIAAEALALRRRRAGRAGAVRRAPPPAPAGGVPGRGGAGAAAGRPGGAARALRRARCPSRSTSCFTRSAATSAPIRWAATRSPATTPSTATRPCPPLLLYRRRRRAGPPFPRARAAGARAPGRPGLSGLGRFLPRARCCRCRSGGPCCALEDRLPAAAFRLLGFRLLAVLRAPLSARQLRLQAVHW